jgi:hypothetical protein
MNITQVLAGHESRNRILVERILFRGGDLNEVRDIDVHFVSSNEQEAKRLMFALQGLRMIHITIRPNTQEAKSRGTFLIKMLISLFIRTRSPGKEWVVEGQLQTTVNRMVDAGFTTKLVVLASRYSAIYDGWGTPI